MGTALYALSSLALIGGGGQHLPLGGVSRHGGSVEFSQIAENLIAGEGLAFKKLVQFVTDKGSHFDKLEEIYAFFAVDDVFGKILSVGYLFINNVLDPQKLQYERIYRLVNPVKHRLILLTHLYNFLFHRLIIFLSLIDLIEEIL